MYAASVIEPEAAAKARKSRTATKWTGCGRHSDRTKDDFVGRYLSRERRRLAVRIVQIQGESVAFDAPFANRHRRAGNGAGDRSAIGLQVEADLGLVTFGKQQDRPPAAGHSWIGCSPPQQSPRSVRRPVRVC